MKIRKAVIPVAGFGTRFLPASRSVPKVMLPVLETPFIHFAVEEATRAGIDQIIFVVSRRQEAVSAYFGAIPDLEEALQKQGKHALLEQMQAISEMADIRVVPQDERLGLGNAVLQARPLVGNEPFAVLLPDDIIWSEGPTIGRMMELFGDLGGFVIAVREVPDEMVPSLGVIRPEPMGDDIFRVAQMVEKPSLSEAPSNLAIIGRYVLPPQVFDMLERTPPGALGEIQLTDGMAMLLQTYGAFAYRFPGRHFDVGTPLGLLKASVHAAMQRGDLAGDFGEWLNEVIHDDARRRTK